MRNLSGDLLVIPDIESEDFCVYIKDANGEMRFVGLVAGINIDYGRHGVNPDWCISPQKKAKEILPEPIPISAQFVKNKKRRRSAEAAIFVFVEKLIKENGPISTSDVITKIQEHNGYFTKSDLSARRMGHILSIKFERIAPTSHGKPSLWRLRE